MALDKTGLQHLTNKLVQGDAIKVASSKGTTVKEVINNIKRECESITLPNNMILENRVNQFRIGQGRDIDVSRDVEEGLSQIQLQGQTYQNLITFKQKSICDAWPRVHFKRNIDLKPNTVYTFITPQFNSCEISMYIGFNGDGANQLLGYQNRNIGTFTTKTNMVNIGSEITFYYGGSNAHAFVQNCPTAYMLLEGDYSRFSVSELPQYLEGIKSSFEDKVANITIQGKNLFNKNCSDIIKGQALGQNNSLYEAADLFASGPIKVTPNNCYSFIKVRWGWLLDKNGKKVSDCITSSKLEIPNGCEYIRITGSINDLDDMQIEQSSVVTSYEEYRNTNYRFDIKEPLRRLPNGVYDEITKDGKLVRRCGEILFDGSFDLSTDWYSNDTFRTFYYVPTVAKKSGLDIICDKLPVASGYDSIDSNLITCMGDGINFKVNVTDWENKNHVGFSKWLKSNPIKVIYALAEPTITPIDPIEFNICQGTTISINSDIAPISTHEVILNRSGQIEQGIELIADLRNRIDKLEKAYDSNLIATQYRLDNLKLNYELKREEE